ncbi:type II toxin-antitoxin system prevent-host-death family antitoxin [Myxococcota bacterium]|nr:type II toxin-antitoxin system prevent-host-death family antitoxin [Myxococcota bacterium]
MTIGAYEAKTHLSDILDRVARGERIVITRHGVPVAVLQPPEPVPRRDVRQAIAELRAFRRSLHERGVTITRNEIREWIEEGRD